MLSGLSFYLVPKLLASDLILTVDAAAGKAGIWPGGSLQNSELGGGGTFLLPTRLRAQTKSSLRVPRAPAGIPAPRAFLPPRPASRSGAASRERPGRGFSPVPSQPDPGTSSLSLSPNGSGPWNRRCARSAFGRAVEPEGCSPGDPRRKGSQPGEPDAGTKVARPHYHTAEGLSLPPPSGLPSI